MLLQADTLLELLNTKSVTVVGILLLIIGINVMFNVFLYKELVASREKHREEMKALYQDYIDTINENKDKLIELIDAYNRYMKTVKDVLYKQ